jgi:hypothetical protein
LGEQKPNTPGTGDRSPLATEILQFLRGPGRLCSVRRVTDDTPEKEPPMDGQAPPYPPYPPYPQYPPVVIYPPNTCCCGGSDGAAAPAATSPGVPAVPGVPTVPGGAVPGAGAGPTGSPAADLLNVLGNIGTGGVLGLLEEVFRRPPR